MKRRGAKRSYPGHKRQKSSGPRWLMGLGVMVIVGATLLVYLPAMGSGFIWNDDTYVSENSVLKEAGGLTKIWSLRMRSKSDGQWYVGGYTEQYYPLVFSSFWLESQLWGNENPTGFHVVNVLLHIANALLIWLICRRLGLSWGYIVALLFALHPVAVESVAWITERKNVLSGLFYLLALLSYLRFNRSGRRAFYGIAFGCFVLALLSKTVTCSLPVILLLVLWLRHGRVGLKDLLGVIPFFVVGAVLGLFTAYYEHYSVGAVGLEWQLAFWQRLVIAGRAVFFYMGKLLWPMNLTFIYPRWNPPGFSPLDLVWPMGVVLVTVGLWYWRKVIGPGALAAWGGFIVSLFPALGFFDVYPFRFSFVADQFQYLGSMFFIALVVGGIYGLYKRFSPVTLARSAVRWAGIGVVVVFFVLLGWLSWAQAGIYENRRRLWLDTLEKNPQAWIAWNNVGREYTLAGEHGKAIEVYKQAIAVKPDAALAHEGLAGSYATLGRNDEAIAQYKDAIGFERDYAKAYYGLGTTYVKVGRYREAIAACKEAIRIKKGFAMAHATLGVAYAGAGQGAQAIRALKEAVRIKPDYAAAHFNLSKVYWGMGDRASALKHLEILERVDKPSADELGKLIRK